MTFIGILVLSFIIGLLPAWALMLLLGALAHLTGWHVAISFWACYILVIILGLFMPKGSAK